MLVAFVILALALGTLLPGFASGLRGLGAADGYTTAALLAESHLAAVGRDRPLAEGATRGEYENGFGWQLEITARDDLDPDQRLPVRAYDVVLTVLWEAGGDSPRSIRLQTLRLGPV